MQETTEVINAAANDFANPLVIASLAGAFCTIIAAIATAVVTILQAIQKTNTKLDDAKTKVEINDAKTDALHQKAEKIEQLANGSLDKLRIELNEANAEIRNLEKKNLKLQQENLFKRYGLEQRKRQQKPSRTKRTRPYV